MKEEKRVEKKPVEKKAATFRGKAPQRARGAARIQKTEKELRKEGPKKPVRNRGIKRRR